MSKAGKGVFGAHAHLKCDLPFLPLHCPLGLRGVCLLAGAPTAGCSGGYSQAFELRLWPDQHPLRQFEQQLSYELLRKLEDRNLTLDVLAVRCATAV